MLWTKLRMRGLIKAKERERNHRRHAGVPIDATLSSPCIQLTGHTGDVNCRRLHPHTRNMCRTKEFIRSDIKFQQWSPVRPSNLCQFTHAGPVHSYTQCELMSVHYKTPVLLIEFEEDKAFSLDVSPVVIRNPISMLRADFQVVSDMKSYAKPTNKYPKKKPGAPTEPDYSITIQSKITLLILTFPRVRIIWSSSPYATTEIFNDLKRITPNQIQQRLS